MSEDVEQSPDESRPEEYSEALLQSAIEGLKARGDSARRFACMSLPGPLFKDLCARLMDRTQTVRATAEWLAGQSDEAPTRSSVERFSDALYEEYRACQLQQTCQESQRYIAAVTDGDPAALKMAANWRLNELLTGELMRAQRGEAIDTKRLIAIIMGVRSTAQTAFDKEKMDARIHALEVMNSQRETTIKLLDQRLARLPEQVKAIQEKLDQVEKAGAAGKKVDAAVFAAIRAELTRVKEAA